MVRVYRRGDAYSYVPGAPVQPLDPTKGRWEVAQITYLAGKEVCTTHREVFIDNEHGAWLDTEEVPNGI